MVWCPLGNKEIQVNAGVVTDDDRVSEFFLSELCDGCQYDFGLSSYSALVGEYVMALLVNTDEEEVVRCEIDK